jgi:CheY-like chemotaxis protein
MAHVGLLEDNTRIAKLSATMLRYAGHRVTVYNHPQACLQALLPEFKVESLSSVALPSHTSVPTASAVPAPLSARSTRVACLPFDVLIMDLHLPDITGIDVLRILRNHTRTLSLPLIFCTAATPYEISTALSIAPQAHFIEKPFTFQELNTAIAGVLHS